MVTISIPAKQSDHLLNADCDDTAFGEGTLTWQDPVHSWKAGPSEVMTDCGKQTKTENPWLWLILFHETLAFRQHVHVVGYAM